MAAAANRSNAGLVSRIRRALFPLQNSCAIPDVGSKNMETDHRKKCDSLVQLGALSKPSRPSGLRRGQRDTSKARDVENIPPSFATIVSVSNDADSGASRSSRGRRRADRNIHASVLDKLSTSPRTRFKKIDRRADAIGVLGACADNSSMNSRPQENCSLGVLTSNVVATQSGTRVRETLKKPKRRTKTATKAKSKERKATRAQLRVKRSRYVKRLGQEDSLMSLKNPSSSTIHIHDMSRQLLQVRSRDSTDVQDVLGQSQPPLHKISPPHPSENREIDEGQNTEDHAEDEAEDGTGAGAGANAETKKASEIIPILKSPMQKKLNMLSKRQRKQLSPSVDQVRNSLISTPSSTVVNWGSPSSVTNPPKRRDQKKTPARSDDYTTTGEEAASIVQITVSAVKEMATTREQSLSRPLCHRESTTVNELATRLFEDAREVAIDNVCSRSTKRIGHIPRSAKSAVGQGSRAGAGSHVFDLEEVKEVAIDNVLSRSTKRIGHIPRDAKSAVGQGSRAGPGSRVFDIEEASLTFSSRYKSHEKHSQPTTSREEKEFQTNRTNSKKTGNGRRGKTKYIRPQPINQRRSARQQIPTDRLTITWDTDRHEKTQEVVKTESDTTVTGKKAKSSKQKKQAPNTDKISRKHTPEEVAGDTGKMQRQRRQVKKVDHLAVSWKDKEPQRESSKVVDGASSDHSKTSAGDKICDDMFGEYEQMCRKKQNETKPARETLLEEESPTSTRLQKTITHASETAEKANTLQVDEQTSPNLQWTQLQIHTLRQAFNAVDPTSTNFWEEIASHVDSKTAVECREKWFSLVQTPNARSRKAAKNEGWKNLQRNNGKHVECDDDIFNSTPFRTVSQSTDQDIPSEGDVRLPCDFGSPISHSPLAAEEIGGSDIGVDSPTRFRIGYKGYVKGLAKLRRKGGMKLKERGDMSAPRLKQKQKTGRPIAAEIGAGDVQMNGVLTPGGTVQVRAPTESDLEDLVIRPGEEYSDDEESIEQENARLMME